MRASPAIALRWQKGLACQLNPQGIAEEGDASHAVSLSARPTGEPRPVGRPGFSMISTSRPAGVELGHSMGWARVTWVLKCLRYLPWHAVFWR